MSVFGVDLLQALNSNAMLQKRVPRITPLADAKWWIDLQLDKNGFALKYVSDYKGKLCIFHCRKFLAILTGSF